MIKSINLKKVATFDEVGIQIEDLKKINFIYGANGSGKTTLTKLIDNPNDPVFSECTLVWEGNIPIKALVYNKDFRSRNFGKGKMDGVFTLGQATKEEIEKIAKMQIELAEIKDNLINKKNSWDYVIGLKQNLENEFKDKIWLDVYKKFEVEFKEAFVGVIRKDLLKNRLLDEFESRNSVLKTFDELAIKAKTIFGEIPVEIPSIAPIEFSRIIEIETDEIWQKKIIGKADVEIAKLIQKLNLNDWVNEGRSFLQENSTCPFCQQPTITNDFRTQLENYFDETFTTDIGLVKSNVDKYNRLALNLTNLLQQIETKEKSNLDTKLNIEPFAAYLNTLSSQFISNKELLNNKIKEPSRSVTLISVEEQLQNIQNLILEANVAIQRHNAIVNNYAIERSVLINDIWRYLAEESKSTIEAFIKKSNGMQRGINALEKQYQELRLKYAEQEAKIKEANKNITSVQPSVDEINRILKSYGFNNFEIVPSKTEKNQYQIQREDGTIAESTLSEGEITFITFLYFLQLSKGSISQESISDERILVIDDPISSLDSNVLFVISSLLKEIIKAIKKCEVNIKQLILLTHNVYFHKEVSFIDGRTKEDGETYYWILRRNKKISTIQKFEMHNPIQNSYELLWQELKNKDHNSGITIQNTMRRILENYFKILGKYGDDELIMKFENNQDQEICRSLISWINDGSHSIPDDLYVEHQDSTIEKYYEVFEKIFITMGHSEHYNMMIKENVN
ncbi:MAG: AAA family ATPase [Ignavibacterium sp.]|nr:AAA family ATPase [Ignavibacterium sp.]